MHDVNEEVAVMIHRDFRLDARALINEPPRQLARRASVAGAQLYIVNDVIRETGFDFLGRIARSNRMASASAI